jgi:hypothetical protein
LRFLQCYGYWCQYKLSCRNYGFWRFPDVRHQIHSICMLSSQVWYLQQWRISRPEISESWKLHELLFLALVECHNLRASNTLSYFAIVTISLYIKEILTRRQRNKWDVDYLPLRLLVEVRWICASSHPPVTCLYETVGSNVRKAPNKAVL